MAKKSKPKISKVKRNNHTTNKMNKQGKLKLQRHRQKVQKQKQPTQPQVEYSSESEASGDEWADMLDDEEQKYIMRRLAKQPQLLSNVPEKETENKSRSRKRKKVDKGKVPKHQLSNDSGAESEGNESDASELEENYEKELTERPPKKMRQLLPIKTKDGVQERMEEVEDSDSEKEEQGEGSNEESADEEAEDTGSDSGMESAEKDNDAQDGEVISAVQLLAARRDRLNHEKLRIGALCSSLLESPEKKLKNFFPILYLMEDRLKDDSLNLHSVRKLATLSAFEVFKDILPDYYLRHQDFSNIKLKKDTLSLYKYEKELLEFYKRYLQRLEKAAAVLRRKKGDNRKPDEAAVSLATVSLSCMAGLLVARPQFNYASNIAQSIVPFLDCRRPQARELVTEACKQVFADDKKGEITLTIVRLINQLVKRRGERLLPAALDCLLSLRIRDVDMDAQTDVQHKKKQEEKHKKRIINLSKKEKKVSLLPAALDCLLSLRIRDVDMDAQTDVQHKKKQEEKHKKRIINLSKKEKKRAKKLKEVERELLETDAQESEIARRKQLAEVCKTVFHIYFRLLKAAPAPGLLAAALRGLAKFTHVINLEYYSDLVAILSRLLTDELVAPRARLLCVRTALAILTGAGDALNVDPAKFHAYLYSAALTVHAGSSQSDSKIVLEAISQVCSRARRVSANVLQAFAKRLLTCAAQLQHHAALAGLQLLHQMAQQSKPVSTLLEPYSEASGCGRYEPLLPSPEHANAHAAASHELCRLRRHYHPTVRDAARAVATGTFIQELNKMILSSPEHTNAHAAASHELCRLRRHYHPTVRDAARAVATGTFIQELNKMSPMQIFEAYDGSQMAFKPAIPAPKRQDGAKAKLTGNHHWAQTTLKDMCEAVENGVELVFRKDEVR